MGPSPQLGEAIGELRSSGTQALDLGTGAGRDARYLAGRGFIVTAVDADPACQQYTPDGIRLVNTTFEEFDFGNYDLINASYSLPFCPPNRLPAVLGRLASALNPGGIFTGQLFGIEDERNVENSGKSFYTIQQIRTLLNSLEIVKINEQLANERTVSGRVKRWHVFDIIARKHV